MASHFVLLADTSPDRLTAKLETFSLGRIMHWQVFSNNLTFWAVVEYQLDRPAMSVNEVHEGKAINDSITG